MPKLHKYKIFISHAFAYHNDYEKIIEFLNKANNFDFANYSIAQDKKFQNLSGEQLAEQLREQIRPVEIVLVLAGMYVAYRDWIQFEINFAHQLKKPILPIKPWGSQRYPDVLEFAEGDAVGWNTDSIVQAIRNMT
ncbi:MAG: TIR domain-containing protein [Magnetococcales bacterium]|nr:TIR domain-containing protein [Magnetococcales bacterium]